MISLSEQAWSWLRRELDTWAEQGASASFWWRDDDAVTTGAAFTRLLDLSRMRDTPLSIAVIPERMESGKLAPDIAGHRQLTVLQHGFAHTSHARSGERKLELGGSRAPDSIVADLRRGLDILGAEFGSSFLPVLVPPWNRIDPGLLPLLAEIGFRGLSTMKVRKRDYPAPGVHQVNCHLDPVNWRRGKNFIGIYPAIAILVQHLRSRRLGYRDAAEPTGLLTHHLVQNDCVWRFCGQLIDFIDEHPATSWVGAAQLWSQAEESRESES